MASPSAFSESEILADVLAADQGDMSPEAARSVLRWKFSDRAVARMNRLAGRNQRGTITSAEREQLEKFLRVGSLVNLLQAKARLSLSGRGSRET